MRNHSFRAAQARAAIAAAMVVVLNGCGLDQVEVPDFEGPAELALSLRLTASPDIVVADGFSSSLVQAQLRGPNGEALAGRQIFVAVADSQGRTADIGQLRATGSGGIGTGLVLTTNANGIAQASYEAPPRTDMTGNASAIIQARPIGDDFEGQVYRTVRIELRSAEPRLFPQDPTNASPVCGFIVEAVSGQCGTPIPTPAASGSPGGTPTPIPQPSPVNGVVCTVRANTTVLFQTTARDSDGTIVRYEWFFGDGTRDDKPDLAKVYRVTGTFNVTHLVTDNSGAQAACQSTLTVIP